RSTGTNQSFAEQILQRSVAGLLFRARAEGANRFGQIAGLHIANAKPHVAKILFGGKLARGLKIAFSEIKLIFHGVSDAALKNQPVGIWLVAQTNIEDFKRDVKAIVVETQRGQIQVVVLILGLKLSGLTQRVYLRLQVSRTAVGFREQV